MGSEMCIRDRDYYDALQAEYTHKKDLFLKGLDDLKIVHNDPEGAYYVMLDISEFGYESDLQFCEDLASKVGVGAVPGSERRVPAASRRAHRTAAGISPRSRARPARIPHCRAHRARA